MSKLRVSESVWKPCMSIPHGHMYVFSHRRRLCLKALTTFAHGQEQLLLRYYNAKLTASSSCAINMGSGGETALCVAPHVLVTNIEQLDGVLLLPSLSGKRG